MLRFQRENVIDYSDYRPYKDLLIVTIPKELLFWLKFRLIPNFASEAMKTVNQII